MQPRPWLLQGLLPDHGVLEMVANVGLNVAILLLPILGATVFLIQRYRRPAPVGA